MSRGKTQKNSKGEIFFGNGPGNKLRRLAEREAGKEERVAEQRG